MRMGIDETTQQDNSEYKKMSKNVTINRKLISKTHLTFLYAQNNWLWMHSMYEDENEEYVYVTLYNQQKVQQ
jgi:hypothetical protein